MTTPYHARYFAHELSRRRPSDGDDRLSTSLFDACVDLNPHQIDAAMFALQSPVSKGVILADEVGLGKTIEAGLILCQLWAERRRRLLVICPAAIRKQWALELEEKFNLPTLILDGSAYRQARDDGNPTPFLADRVVIASINYASSLQNEVRAVPWDLVVVDEAHKLRNAYRPSNKMGQRLRWALEDRRKVLLTATPLQNSLLELYGLTTIIDEHIFGDPAAFRAQYQGNDGNLEDLRQRLADFCKRTLRKQVVEYIRYTERRALTRPFHPTDDEHKLYEAISAFLTRPDTYSIPRRQRALTTLILRKLLASSSHAIAGTLDTMRSRLQGMRTGAELSQDILDEIVGLEEVGDEYLEAASEPDDDEQGKGTSPTEPPKLDPLRLDAEIRELEQYSNWARSVGVDTKSRSLLSALQIGFAEMERMGANRKAVIFTESRRTQDYLKAFLEANGYAGKIVLFNGSNGDADSRLIFERWVGANRESGRVTGSRAVDLRIALIEHFRDSAEIMIATEAAAEGVNLQFCSLVVNYDLPWNPQRIEQRIGRCHRYGQQHDVVVVNFLNERNDADQRVLELLTEKFNLFSGVFGASDEVLGSIESGVDFEKRILAIYQECRTPSEIEAAFAQLQREMDAVIKSRLEQTRRELLEHFDEDVHARLKLRLSSAREQLDQVGRLFWALTRYVLSEQAWFDDDALAFQLHAPPLPDVPRGRYQLISKAQPSVPSEFLYRLSHRLGEHVIAVGKNLLTPAAHLIFDMTAHPTRIATVEALIGQTGWLTLQRLVIDSFDREEHLLFSAVGDDGRALDQETCEKLFRCDGTVSGDETDTVADLKTDPLGEQLTREARRHLEATIARSLETNSQFFRRERDRLERWTDDVVAGAEKDLADVKARIRALNRQARVATTTEEQHDLQLKIRELERDQRRQRQRIFDLEDKIKEKRDHLIDVLERRLSQRTSCETLFTIRWEVR